MPELPEVETIVRNNRDRLIGRRVTDFASHWPKNSTPDAASIRTALVECAIADVWRRAKFIIFTLERDLTETTAPERIRNSKFVTPNSKRTRTAAGYLLIHLRMSGRLEWADDARPAAQHVRATFTFSDGERLLFCDARKFGRIIWTRDLTSITADLGVEPLDDEFRPALLRDLLKSRARAIKPLLLDQSVIAGLGNIYTDEALHRAGVHPLTRSDRVRPDVVRRLHAAIRAVLKEGIRRNGTSIDWIYPSGEMQDYLRVYGRTGKPCRRCKTVITALRVGQRGTHVCPRCQPRR